MRRAALLLLLILPLAACSSATGRDYGGTASNASAPQAARGEAYSDSKYSMAYDSYEAPMAPSYDGVATTSGVIDAAQAERKIIKTASLSVETKEYDQASRLIREQTVAFGGFVQSSSMSQYSRGNSERLRSASFTLRVPQEAFDQAVEALRTVGTVTRSSTGSDDVSQAYYDIEARLNLKQAEEARLLVMLSKATDISDLIMLEQRLSNIRAEIEQYQSRLTNIDRLADYATITVDLLELSQSDALSGEGFGGQIVRAFRASLSFIAMCGRGVVLFFAAVIAPLAVLCAIAGITLLFVKLFKRKP